MTAHFPGLLQALHIHDRSFPWLATDTSMKKWWNQASFMGLNPPVSEMIQSCKCFPHVSKIPTLIYNWVNSVDVKSHNLELYA